MLLYLFFAFSQVMTLVSCYCTTRRVDALQRELDEALNYDNDDAVDTQRSPK